MSDKTNARPTSALIGKIAGIDICRRAIYQTVIGREGWANDMLKAMAACRMLGVQTFEIDVRYDQNAKRPTSQKKHDTSGIASMFFTFGPMEGEEWKEEKAEAEEPKGKRGADVLTLYAVVVE